MEGQEHGGNALNGATGTKRWNGHGRSKAEATGQLEEDFGAETTGFEPKVSGNGQGNGLIWNTGTQEMADPFLFFCVPNSKPFRRHAVAAH